MLILGIIKIRCAHFRLLNSCGESDPQAGCSWLCVLTVVLIGPDRGPRDGGPPLQSLHDGGERPAHPDHQPLHRPRALAGGHAAPRDR